MAVVANSQRCARCAARAGRSTDAQPSAPGSASATERAEGAITINGSSSRKPAIGAWVVLLTMAILGIGGGVYAYHAAKKKGTAALREAGILRNAARTSVGASPDTLSHSAASDASESTSGFAPWKPSSANSTATSAPAPLRQGMLVVTAIADTLGDYESFEEITNIDEKGVTLSYRSERPKSVGAATSPSSETSASRTVLSSDLASAHHYEEVFGSSDPQSFPGSTAVTSSRDVLAELKEKGATHFSFRPDGVKGGGDGSLAKIGNEECTLKRQGSSDFAFPLLLNEEPTAVPALHAHCTTDDGPADFYILDQLDYPLMLSWKLGEGAQLQVIKITYPKEREKKSPLKMEEDLAEKKKIEIYGIYFDFGSDRLNPESSPVLDEIARAMQNHTGWKLSVSGHTDNLGGDAYNLDLSKRRAAAVKQALVARYHIDRERLTTDGYGAGRPVDTNETLQGRARNRRVELARE